jgi:hypothetical protein
MPRILIAFALTAAPPAFFEFLASSWSETGASLDPNGGPAPRTDEGCRIDPNGGCLTPHGDTGSRIDPDG